MAKIFCVVLVAICSFFMACTDSFTDPRDGRSYDVVQIGNTVWMAENLNFDMDRADHAGGAEQAGEKIAESFCPDGDERNCGKYGRLYPWEAAKMACPEGWRLPTRENFEQLMAVATLNNAAAPNNTAGKSLKSTSGWFKKGNGSDDLGFNALPAGFMTEGKFDGIGGYAHIWSGSADSSEPAFAQYLFLDFSSDAAHISSFSKTDARSVRCVRDVSTAK